jgi:hypothetical protein
VDFFDRMAWGVSTFTVVLMLPSLLMGLAIPYAVLRLRDVKGEPEPQAGFKAALYFFFSLSMMLVMTGLTIIVVDLVMTTDFGLGAPRNRFGGREPFPNDAQRTSFGFMISGGLFALIHFICILTLTDRPFSSPVRRMFIGWRFAIHGIIVMFAVTALMIVLFQKDVGFNGLSQFRRFLIGVLLVWAPSWFVHLVLLRVSSPVTPPPRRDRWTPADLTEERPYDRPRRPE